MAKKKKKNTSGKVAVKSYSRKFRPEKLPPRDRKGRWSEKRKKRSGAAGQEALFG